MPQEIRDVVLSETTTAIPPLPHDICKTDAQCLNGGHCNIFKPGQIKSGIDDEYNYCTCQNGFGGTRCEVSCPLQCQNGGRCHPRNAQFGTVKLHETNPYMCQCLGHFTGILCDTPYENCADGSQCYNGGSCQEREDIVSVSYCECPSKWGGDACQDEIVESQITTNTTASQIKYVALGIILGITLFFSIGLLLMKRRRRRNERRYHAIQASEDFHSGIETKNVRTRQEKWRNVV